MVLINDDMEKSRLKWPLGVVVQVFPGRDCVVRTAEIKTASGTIVRSVQRLHDLEVVRDSFDGPVSTELDTSTSNTSADVSLTETPEVLQSQTADPIASTRIRSTRSGKEL